MAVATIVVMKVAVVNMGMNTEMRAIVTKAIAITPKQVRGRLKNRW